LLLEARQIECLYGNLPAITEINLTVSAGEIVSVIGSNGAGKSTLLKTITGHKYPNKGRVRFEDCDITFLPPWDRIALGMAFVPEGRHLFGGLSVEENLFLGGFPLRKGTDKNALREHLNLVYELFPVLKGRRKQIVKTLSGGEQQMLAIGRGLVSNPRLLLIDELSLGLAPLVKKEIYGTLLRLHNEEQKTVLLVEQDVKEALRIADRGYLIQTGRIVLQGPAQELANDPAVRDFYLGAL